MTILKNKYPNLLCKDGPVLPVALLNAITGDAGRHAQNLQKKRKKSLNTQKVIYLFIYWLIDIGNCSNTP